MANAMQPDEAGKRLDVKEAEPNVTSGTGDSPVSQGNEGHPSARSEVGSPASVAAANDLLAALDRSLETQMAVVRVRVIEDVASYIRTWAARQESLDLPGVVARLEDLAAQTYQEIASVRKDFQEAKTAKERLEQMQREQLFEFTKQIDAESFHILCAVLAYGDVAKASQALNVPDATLRSRIAKWDQSDPVRKAILQLIRWRKRMGRHEAVPLNLQITQGSAPSVDYPGLLSDLLDGLLAMDKRNWRDQADRLAEFLRPYVPR